MKWESKSPFVSSPLPLATTVSSWLQRHITDQMCFWFSCHFRQLSSRFLTRKLRRNNKAWLQDNITVRSGWGRRLFYGCNSEPLLNSKVMAKRWKMDRKQTGLSAARFSCEISAPFCSLSLWKEREAQRRTSSVDPFPLCWAALPRHPVNRERSDTSLSSASFPFYLKRWRGSPSPGACAGRRTCTRSGFAEGVVRMLISMWSAQLHLTR